MKTCALPIITYLIIFTPTPTNAFGQDTSSQKLPQKTPQKATIVSNTEVEQFEEKRSRCFQGLAAACTDAANVELNRNRIEGARNFFAQGCKYGDQQSCMGIAIIHERKGNIGDAKIVYKQACESGIPHGCLQWSRVEYQTGNDKEGAHILNEACVKRGYKEACRAEDDIRRKR
jgi:hypothetical protein